MDLKIDSKNANKTVKTLVREMGISRNQLIELKKSERGILLNGDRVTVRAVLAEGDTLSLELEDKEEDENPYLIPLDIPLDILFEDDHLTAVNKPQGMPTHPSLHHYDDTLANALASYYNKKGIPFVFRAVNRLDAGTAGVVLVAKDHLCATLLGAQMQSGQIRKTYLLIAEGDIGEENGRIEGYIRRKGESIIERELLSSFAPSSEYSLTEWRALERGERASLIEAHPKTGRTHQLRVHFASCGHPIVGDTMYGSASEIISSQALCASELEFIHPFTNEKMIISAPLPKEMLKLREVYFGKRDF